MNFYIEHHQDLTDAFSKLKATKMPFILSAVRSKPKEGEQYESWKRVNSFFHRGIVPCYSELAGLLEDEAKEDLQRRFATVTEYHDHYEVESVGAMSLPRLVEFTETCQMFLIQTFGERANEMIDYNRKTKVVKK